MPLVEPSVEEFGAYAGASKFGTVGASTRLKLTGKALEKALDEAFPAIDPGEKATGVYVVIQKRYVPKKTAGGIIRPDDSRDMDQRAMAKGRVVSMGSGAFFDSQSGKVMTGDFKIGDFVRFPKWGGVEWRRGEVDFVLWPWWEVRTVITDLNELVS